MDEFLKGECPHCGQAIEYPAEGTGQTVPCPTCATPFVLKPCSPPAPVPPAPPPAPAASLPDKPVAKSTVPSAVSPAVPPATPTAGSAVMPEKETPAPKPKDAPQSLDQAFLEIQSDRLFEGRPPTREQVARAWALVRFRRSDGSARPTHVELVAALGELFKEFKQYSGRSRQHKSG